MIYEYFKEIEQRIDNTAIITDKSLDLREFGAKEGMIRGRRIFLDGSMLEFMEYLQEEKRLKYRFHLMDKEGNMLFRYDNAPHHKEISSFPHHKHLPDDVAESNDKGIMDVLDELEVSLSDTITIK